MVDSCTFTANKAMGGANNRGGPIEAAVGLAGGGAIGNELGARLTVTGGTFQNNLSQGGANSRTRMTETSTGLVSCGLGGAIANLSVAKASISGGRFIGNRAVGGMGSSSKLGQYFDGSGSGGAVGNFDAHLSVKSGHYEGNVAEGARFGSSNGYGSQGAGGAIISLGALARSDITDAMLCYNQAHGGDSGSGQTGGNAAGDVGKARSRPRSEQLCRLRCYL